MDIYTFTCVFCHSQNKTVCPRTVIVHLPFFAGNPNLFDEVLILVFLFFFAHAVVLPKSIGALTDGSVENPTMHPAPTVGRPPGQRGRKPGRRKTKMAGPWSQKCSALGPQSATPGKDVGPIKIPKKRGPKPGSRVGVTEFIQITKRKCNISKQNVIFGKWLWKIYKHLNIKLSL